MTRIYGDAENDLEASAPSANGDVKVAVELGVDRERGAVRVTPAKLPAKMIVAPNSPRPRANASDEPAASPLAASGSATQKKRPGRGRARASREASTRCVDPRRRTRPSRPGVCRRGSRRTRSATTTAGLGEREADTPNASREPPSRPRLPKAASSAIPATAGGTLAEARTASGPRSARRPRNSSVRPEQVPRWGAPQPGRPSDVRDGGRLQRDEERLALPRRLPIWSR